MSLQLRYPNITGRTPEERQQQMERHVRSMIDQLNLFLKKTGETESDSQTGISEEALNSKISKTEKDFAKQMKEYWDKLHPVGSIYLSVSDTNPETLFGGKWEQIQDRFLLAAGSTYSAGATGGEATHALTVNEMPSHRHAPSTRDSAGSESGYKRFFTTNLATGSESVARTTTGSGSGKYAMTATTISDINEAEYTTYAGGGAAHNNMPPYLAVYVWKRIE